MTDEGLTRAEATLGRTLAARSHWGVADVRRIALLLYVSTHKWLSSQTKVAENRNGQQQVARDENRFDHVV